MAITAHFGADFTNFLSAVNAADTKLKGFQEDAAKVQASVNRIGDSFSGKKIIQEAQLAAKAVADIGGVTFLTQKEQARLNATVTEAIAKYNALGSEAPEDLRRIQRETTKIDDAAKDVTSSVKGTGSSFKDALIALGPLGSAITAAFSVQAVISFAKEVLAAADALTKLHDKTDISFQGLQRFQIAGNDAGNTIEQLTSAVSKFQITLADNKPPDDFIRRLNSMGLSIEHLRSLDADQQFIELSDAIREIKDPLDQARAAADLFGGRLGPEILPTLKRGFDDLRDSVGLMSDRTVLATDRAGDALGAYVLRVKNTAANVTVEFAKIFGQGITRPFQIEREIAEDNLAFIESAAAKLAGRVNQLRLPQAAPIPASEAAERDLDRQLQESIRTRREAAQEADRINKERNSAEARWIRISVENTNQWADAVTAIERNMLNERRTLETAFYRNEEAKALATQRRQLDAFTKSVEDMNEEIQSALIPFAGEVGTDFSKELLDNLKSLRTSVPQLITDAFTGGGGLKGSLKAIGVQLANAFIQSFIDELISKRGAIKNVFAGLFGGGASGTVRGTVAKGGLPALVGLIPGLGGAKEPDPSTKLPVASNEPVPPPPGTIITTPTPGSGVAPGPGNPGGSVTQSILTGGFRNPLTAGAAPVTNHTSVVFNVTTPDAGSFDRDWQNRMANWLNLELLSNQRGTVTSLNRLYQPK